MSHAAIDLRLALFGLAILSCVHWPSLAQAQSPAATCNALSASPFDPDVPKGQGVAFDKIKFEEALPACVAALAEAPGDARLLFHYARALDAAGRAAEAVAAYNKAIDAGSVLALNALGVIYDGGYGVPEDASKAAQYYERAANAGLAVAMANLGYLYEQGRGVAQDYAKAAALYGQAAKAGDAVAAGSLGYLTEKGLGVVANDVEAVRLYRIGAAGGEAFAQRNLGIMFANGRGGLATSPADAFGLFKMAADQHFAPAYIDLARAYRDGVGTPTDQAQSERYLRLAIAEGDAVVKSDAQNDLAWLFTLSKQNLEEAEALARAAIGADPEKAFKLDTLAWVLHLRGRHAEALPIAEKAVQLDSTDAGSADHLKAIRAAAGQ